MKKMLVSFQPVPFTFCKKGKESEIDFGAHSIFSNNPRLKTHFSLSNLFPRVSRNWNNFPGFFSDLTQRTDERKKISVWRIWRNLGGKKTVEVEHVCKAVIRMVKKIKSFRKNENQNPNLNIAKVLLNSLQFRPFPTVSTQEASPSI